MVTSRKPLIYKRLNAEAGAFAPVFVLSVFVGFCRVFRAYSASIMMVLLSFLHCSRKEEVMMKDIFSFLSSVIAGIVANYVSKWLDRRK